MGELVMRGRWAQEGSLVRVRAGLPSPRTLWEARTCRSERRAWPCDFCGPSCWSGDQAQPVGGFCCHLHREENVPRTVLCSQNVTYGEQHRPAPPGARGRASRLSTSQRCSGLGVAVGGHRGPWSCLGPGSAHPVRVGLGEGCGSCYLFLRGEEAPTHARERDMRRRNVGPSLLRSASPTCGFRAGVWCTLS